MHKHPSAGTTCSYCDRPFDIEEGYGYRRENGITSFICPNCAPAWFASGVSGTFGVSIATRPYWQSLVVRFLRALREGRFPRRISTIV